jgi:hypothetical protein
MLTVFLEVRVHIHHKFYENIPNGLKVKYCEKDKEIICTLQTALTIQKFAKIA